MLEYVFLSTELKKDGLVKSPKPKWVCKKLHIRGTEITYHLRYVEMICDLYPKSTSFGRVTKNMKSFYESIKNSNSAFA